MFTHQQFSDLAALAEQDTQHSQVQQSQARSLARSACNQGIALMGQAESNNYQNREQVIQACGLFMDAIQVARRQIEPYLHMARALLVFGDDNKALKYLQAARDLEPEHPDVKTYLNYLQNPSLKNVPETAPETVTAPVTAPFTATVPARNLTAELALLDRELGITLTRARQIHQVMKQQASLKSFVRSRPGRSLIKELDRLLDACDRCAETLENLTDTGLEDTALENRERSYTSLSQLLNQIQDALETV